MKNSYDFDSKLRSIIKENTLVSISDEDFTDNSDLIVDFGYDSLSIVHLITEIERNFNIEFEINELVSCYLTSKIPNA